MRRHTCSIRSAAVGVHGCREDGVDLAQAESKRAGHADEHARVSKDG
eukprot:CAMPEP_0119422796 /NCGR_PEP_ID=MMETSP1335-20130426/28934_1 /TAXON_ID=259385 /ORGANISM="Chrysoculter rhomboideus, Strain RCC1486" /LENGTH=46 /DNA_ID= /DNA_START= /DNA_END= /DNA_ORIENTATION=